MDKDKTKNLLTPENAEKTKIFLCEALKPKSSSPQRTQRSQRRAKAIVFGKPETNPFSPQRATEKTKIFFV